MEQRRVRTELFKVSVQTLLQSSGRQPMMDGAVPLQNSVVSELCCLRTLLSQNSAETTATSR
ncbi:hypothetical protein JOB18_006100, partial [Solea senegalensis]